MDALSAVIVLVLVIVMTSFIVHGVFVRLRYLLTAPYPFRSFPKGLYADKWSRAAWLAVATSVLLTLVTGAILLFVPSPPQCPNWHLPDKHSTPLWEMLLMCGGGTLAFLTPLLARWKFVIEDATLESGDFPMPVTYLIALIVFVTASASQLPLAELVGRCWLLPYLNGFIFYTPAGL